MFTYLWQRRWILLSIIIVAVLGYCLWRYYRGPLRKWFNYYVTVVLLEIFWCLVVFFFIPEKRNAGKIAVIVFIVTCFWEFSQLWALPILEKGREIFPINILLGTSFVWWQFPHYLVGAFLGWLYMRGLGKISSA